MTQLSKLVALLLASLILSGCVEAWYEDSGYYSSGGESGYVNETLTGYNHQYQRPRRRPPVSPYYSSKQTHPVKKPGYYSSQQNPAPEDDQGYYSSQREEDNK